MTATEKLFTGEFTKAFSEFKKTGLELTEETWKKWLKDDYQPFKGWLSDSAEAGWKVVHGTYKYQKDE